MNKLLPLLQKCALFKNKKKSEIELFLSKVNHKIDSFEKGETIISPIQFTDKLGIVLLGTVDVQKIFPNGKMIVIQKKRSSDLIGEYAIFSKLELYPHTVIANSLCKVLFLPKCELSVCFSSDKILMLNFLEILSNSNLILEHKIGTLSLISIQKKIAEFLIHYKKHLCKNAHSDIVILPFSKKDWAEYMNVSRTSLSRELKNMEMEGILSFEKRIIIVKNWGQLEKILSL